ncbi:MAG: YbaK/EbsC family protein [Nitrososphaerota archaeon]|nr:YbaK/EbsC family protein [Nitrososphaerota archaeon]
MNGLGVHVEFREFQVSTKSSALAAEALGCSIAEIAKSVVFSAGGAIVVIVSGDKKVDPRRLSALVASPAEMATPEEVRQMTGYPIGGVPPFPHHEGVRVLLDSSLFRFRRVWAAGGAPNAVFGIGIGDLLRIVGTEASELAASP